MNLCTDRAGRVHAYFILFHSALDDTNDARNDADSNHGKQHYVHAFIHLVPGNIAMYCLVISNWRPMKARAYEEKSERKTAN